MPSQNGLSYESVMPLVDEKMLGQARLHGGARVGLAHPIRGLAHPGPTPHNSQSHNWCDIQLRSILFYFLPNRLFFLYTYIC